MKKAWLLAVAFIVLIPLGLLAQSDAASDGYYPWSYARLSYVSGEVFVKRSANLGTEKAEINLALVQGDQLATENGQAEVQLGHRNYLRLDSHSKVEIALLPKEADGRIGIHVLEGNAYLRIGSLSAEKAVEVDTPDASYYVLEEGLYRFNVGQTQQTEALVFEGSLEAAGEAGSVVVRADESIIASNGRMLGDPAPFSSRADDFDQWNEARDEMEAPQSTNRRLPSDLEDYENELDQNGSWTYEQPYGYVWVPYGVGVDWRPYLYGYWDWYPVIGWTWVSSEAWGWPVYHYGRWSWRFGLGWYWIPDYHWGPAWVHWWWDNNYIGWCPLSWYNRPIVVLNNVFYDRFSGRYFPVNNRALTVVRRNELQSPDLARQALRGVELGRLDRIALTAQQPSFEAGLNRGGLQAPGAARVFSTRPGIRSEARNFPSGEATSLSRQRPGNAAAPARESGIARSSGSGAVRSERGIHVYPSSTGAGEQRQTESGSYGGEGRSSRAIRNYPPSSRESSPARSARSSSLSREGGTSSRSVRTYPSRLNREGSSSGSRNSRSFYSPSSGGYSGPSWSRSALRSYYQGYSRPFSSSRARGSSYGRSGSVSGGRSSSSSRSWGSSHSSSSSHRSGGSKKRG